MLKNILKVNGVNKMSKKAQQSVQGGILIQYRDRHECIVYCVGMCTREGGCYQMER